MKFFFVIFIVSLFLKVISIKISKPKLCIDCKYYISNNLDNNLQARCSFFQKDNNIDFLVSGVESEKEYYLCSTAREYDSMCGKKGKKFKKKFNF